MRLSRCISRGRLEEAEAFCRWLTERDQEGQSYRLPRRQERKQIRTSVGAGLPKDIGYWEDGTIAWSHTGPSWSLQKQVLTALTSSLDLFSGLDLDRALDLSRTCVSDFVHILAQARTLAHSLNCILDLTSAHSSDPKLARTLNRARALTSALTSNPDLVHDPDFTRALDPDLARALDRARALDPEGALDLDLACAFARDLDRARDVVVALAFNPSRLRYELDPDSIHNTLHRILGLFNTLDDTLNHFPILGLPRHFRGRNGARNLAHELNRELDRARTLGLNIDLDRARSLRHVFLLSVSDLVPGIPLRSHFLDV